MSEKLLNQYQLSRNFWDFAFENTGRIKPVHIAIYFFAVEHCNRLGWKKKFGLPTAMVLDAINVKSYSVYKKAFDDLVDMNFIEVVEYSKNQYSSNIIALKENNKANNKALDKALIKHASKQCESTLQSTDQSTCESTDSIDKQITNNKLTINKEPVMETDFLIPNMCQAWYKKFPHYSKSKDDDFPAMLKILQFMASQSGQANISDPTVKETILKKLDQVAEEVLKDQFWINKSLNSIANNIQEFYNKIKNPQTNGKEHTGSFKKSAAYQPTGTGGY